MVPAGTDESTKDIRVYENVVAIVETAGKNSQVQIGTLVQAGDGWRVIDLPQAIAEGQADSAQAGFFFQAPMARGSDTASNAPGENGQKLMADLEKLDKAAAAATTPEQQRNSLLNGPNSWNKSPPARLTPRPRHVAAAIGRHDQRGGANGQLSRSGRPPECPV